MAFDFPSSPTTGQTYSISGGPTYVYNGTAWVVLTPGNQFNRTVFTATAGQTTFTMNYVVGAIDVYRNGVKLAPADFTATNGTSIVLLNAATVGDTIEVISYPMITYSDAVRRTGDTMTGALTAPMVVTDSPLQFRNKLINGGFDVWQRGTSFSATTPVFTADRWFVTHAGSSLSATYSRQDAVGVWGQAKYYIRLARTAGSGMTVHSFTQRIEGVETLQNGTATFSFDCRDLTGAQTIGVRLVQSFGSGGSADVTIASQSVSVPSGSTPQRRSVTFDIPSIAGKTIGTSDYLALIIDLPLGGNFQIDLANAQLEAGSVATPFERRLYGQELALCQRYYEKSYDIDVAPGGQTTLGAPRLRVPAADFWYSVQFKVLKRAAPTCVVYSNRVTNAAGYLYQIDGTGAPADRVVSVSSQSMSGFQFYCGTLTAAGNLVEWQWTASAEL